MARSVAAVIAIGRLVLGAALLIAPRQAARAWLGDAVEKPVVVELVRGLGARDIALGGGLGCALTGRPADATRAWLAAGVVADLADMGAALAVRDGIPPRGRWATVAIAGAAALAGGALIRALD